MTTIFVEAFGRLSIHKDRAVDVLDEDLYSVFLARSQLMGWSTIHSSASLRGIPLLWGMNEAELTDEDDGPRIGFAQVGLDVGWGADIVDQSELESPRLSGQRVGEPAPFPNRPTVPPTDPVLAIPPLIQCLDDSLRWFGEAEVAAAQVTAIHIEPRQRSYLHRLVSVLNWFNIGTASERPRALVTVAADQWDAGKEADVVAAIHQRNTGSFQFGSLVTAAAEYAADTDWPWPQLVRTNMGLDVSMPEWSGGAVGWVIGTVFDAALSLEQAPGSLSVRVSRTSE
ncbi:MAG: hypothetical protein OXD50_11630 [Chloroflexi bacterium]|nr:hypothetical protein [Chloroflexota bacterium]